MEMQFFTNRDVSIINSWLMIKSPPTPPTGVEELKAVIAASFPEAEWNDWYCKTRTVMHAMKELSDYNTCKRMQGWIWDVPRTPEKLSFTATPDEQVNIVRVIHPARYDEYLETIWNRPRPELTAIVDIIKKLTVTGGLYVGGLKNVQCESVDVNHNYWELSWVGGKFHNRNIVYLRRGS